MASATPRKTAERALCLALYLLSLLVCGAEGAMADQSERWSAPFGGFFNTSFTFAMDYSFAGISQTKNSPAYQMGIDLPFAGFRLRHSDVVLRHRVFMSVTKAF